MREKTRLFGGEASGRNKRNFEEKIRKVFLGGKEERFSAVSEECCRRELSCVNDLPLRLTDS